MINSVFNKEKAGFQNKVILITGGGSGIGLRTAKEAVLLGATVVIASRNKEKLEIAKTEIQSIGGKVFAFECNIRNQESVNKCIDEILNQCQTIDYLVNNAGGQFPVAAEDISLKGWNAVIDTNLTALFFVSQIVFNKVWRKQNKAGVIVNIIANMWNGFPMMSHTGSARAAVDNLTKTLALEWAKYGIRVNSIAPGTINSSGLTKYGEQFQPVIQQAAKNNLSYRLGTEAEIAGCILFLLSSVSSYISGTTIRIDAGESLFSPLMPPQQPIIPWTIWDDIQPIQTN
eukprot:TRINITY_DN232_c0_g1_i1.p1 TRINITY_DN232_c0_g1~~TRINITY_DN232_c0_g1_i1.p1  ORF type:complete len:287 (+),score=124.28 TRINITY_DN232_c0_g1_i1:557-1417(+)